MNKLHSMAGAIVAGALALAGGGLRVTHTGGDGEGKGRAEKRLTATRKSVARLYANTPELLPSRQVRRREARAVPMTHTGRFGTVIAVEKLRVRRDRAITNRAA